MTLSRFRGAVLFDCDGVITDSEPLNLYCWNQVFLSHLNIKFGSDPNTLVGLDLSEIFKAASKKAYGSPNKLNDKQKSLFLSEKIDLFNTLADKTLTPISGAERLIDDCKKLGLGCGLVSSAKKIRLEKTLSAIGLEDCWDLIFSGEDMYTTKVKLPEKRWGLAANKLQVSCHNCAVIEDSSRHLYSAKEQAIKYLIGIGVHDSMLDFPLNLSLPSLSKLDPSMLSRALL